MRGRIDDGVVGGGCIAGLGNAVCEVLDGGWYGMGMGWMGHDNTTTGSDTILEDVFMPLFFFSFCVRRAGYHTLVCLVSSRLVYCV